MKQNLHASLLVFTVILLGLPTVAADVGPCLCGSCDPPEGDVEWRVTGSGGTKTIVFTSGGQTQTVLVAGGSADNAGAYGICVWPCDTASRWNQVDSCGEMCCSSDPCP